MGLRVRILLDTHVLVWLTGDESRLSSSARQLLKQRSTTVFVSTVSLWELAIKLSLGKLELGIPLSDLIDKELPSNGIEVLPISSEHVLELERLPRPPNGHADPFDRMIVAQAIADGLELVSADAKLDAYGVERTW